MVIVRRIFNLFIGVFIWCSAPAQQQIDSVFHVMYRREGADLAQTLDKLSVRYLALDKNDSALQLGRRALMSAWKRGDSAMVVQTGRHVATALRRLGEIDSAIMVYKAILPISSRRLDHTSEIKVLNGYALAVTFIGQYDKALQLHFESLEMSSSVHDTISMVVTLNNIGLVYYKLTDFRKALRYYMTCEAMKAAINDKFDLDLLMNNIGLCYINLQRYDSAKLFVEQGSLICGSNCRPQRLLEIDFALGVIYSGLDDSINARGYFSRSYGLAKELNSVRFQLENLYYLSSIYIKEGQVRQALAGLHDAENLLKTKSSFNVEKAKIYSNLGNVYLKMGDFRRASYYQLLHSQFKDSVFNENLTRNLLRVEGDRLVQANALKISAKNQQLALKDEIIHRQGVLNAVTTLLVITSLTLVALLFINFSQKKRLNKILERKVEERTSALHLGAARIRNTREEANLLLDRNSRRWTNVFNTLKGLCLNGLKEVRNPLGRSYIVAIYAVISRFAETADCVSDDVAIHDRNGHTMRKETDAFDSE